MPLAFLNKEIVGWIALIMVMGALGALPASMAYSYVERKKKEEERRASPWQSL